VKTLNRKNENILFQLPSSQKIDTESQITRQEGWKGRALDNWTQTKACPKFIESAKVLQ
jgi:hypothetical protein